MKIEATIRKLFLAAGIVLILGFACSTSRTDDATGNISKLKYEVSFPADVHADAITGRMYLLIADKGGKEPRKQTSVSNAHPTGGGLIFGQNFTALEPGNTLRFQDAEAYGFPVASLSGITPGEYFVQGFINIYTEFKRSDGHTLWMHNDRWEGQKWHRSPGNLYSDVVKVHIDPRKKDVIRLECKNVIPDIEVPPDTPWVKRIKFQSEILTEFWGQPIYLGATVLLPKGYIEHPDVSYPVNYLQGHFSINAPYGFNPEPPEKEDIRGRKGHEFYKYWLSDRCPRMIAVTFQHPCPYFDDSYAVNSPNTGPYGDAIMQELIPKVEETFRIIRKPYARVLSGGSTGGWESFALQVFHPDFFGGTWSSCPDPLDFRYYELINIYEDGNAYYRDDTELSDRDYQEINWLKTERPEARETDGQIRYTVRDTYYYEWTIGDKNRSEAQWAIWEAAYGPINEDGYPKRIWDWKTGEIDHAVAEEWKKFDLRIYLANNWSWIGSKLKGKLHIYCGDMDNYYLNMATEHMETFLESTTDPYYDGLVKYGDGKGHCWGPTATEIFDLFTAHITKHAPRGENPSIWKY